MAKPDDDGESLKKMWATQRPMFEDAAGLSGSPMTGGQMAPGPRTPGMMPSTTGSTGGGGSGNETLPASPPGSEKGLRPMGPWPDSVQRPQMAPGPGSVQRPQFAPGLDPMPTPMPRLKPIDPTRPDMGAVPVEGSVIGQSPMNRSNDFINLDGRINNYAQDPRTNAPDKPLSDWQRLQLEPFGANSLSNRAARQVGRSMREHPERRIEQAERDAVANGDMRGAAEMAGVRLGLKQQQQGMEFARGRDERNFEQQKEMFGLHQQAADARNQQERMDRYQMWNAEQEARQHQADQHWQQQMTMFGLKQGADAMEAERVRQQQEQDRTRVPTVGTIPVPGTDYVIPHADGRPMGTLPQHQEKPKAPTHDDISRHIQDMATKGVKAQFGKSGWTYEPHAAKAATVKVVNDQGKVVDFPADHEIPPGWKELKKKGEGGKSSAPKTANGNAEKPSSFLNF